MDPGPTLNTIPPRGAHPLPTIEKGSRFGRRQSLETDTRLGEAGPDVAIRRRDGDAGDHPVAPTRYQAKHSSCLRAVSGLAQNPSTHTDDGVGANDKGVWMASRHGARFREGEARRGLARAFRFEHRLINVGRDNAIWSHPGLRQEIKAAGTGAGENSAESSRAMRSSPSDLYPPGSRLSVPASHV